MTFWAVGAGADDFVFASVAESGHDHVVDFLHGVDRLVFTGADYGFAAGHVLTDAEFTEGSAAVGTGAQFVWDSVAGKLWWDADGAGAGAAFELALISGGATVTKDDLVFG
jgi:Ca2+-binding RTX toxin-like protein